jgi:Serpin (serine protease inhibitor)
MESVKCDPKLKVPILSTELKRSGTTSQTTKSELSGGARNSSGELASPVELKKTVSRKRSSAEKVENPKIMSTQDLNKILGSTLQAILEENKGANVIASPLSLYSCFAMIGEGLAGGKTFKELQRVFGFTEDAILSESLLNSILKA